MKMPTLPHMEAECKHDKCTVPLHIVKIAQLIFFLLFYEGWENATNFFLFFVEGIKRVLAKGKQKKIGEKPVHVAPWMECGHCHEYELLTKSNLFLEHQ